VDRPADSPLRRSRPRPEENAARVRTAVVDDARALALLAREQERIPAARVTFHLAARGSPPVPDGSPPASDSRG
jgi:hypothetical protein